jgi:hypothetical protein
MIVKTLPAYPLPLGNGLTLYKLVFIKKGLSEDASADIVGATTKSIGV